jgi:hypothetical protein
MSPAPSDHFNGKTSLVQPTFDRGSQERHSTRDRPVDLEKHLLPRASGHFPITLGRKSWMDPRCNPTVHVLPVRVS